MKKFIKNYLLNIIFIILSIANFVLAYLSSTFLSVFCFISFFLTVAAAFVVKQKDSNKKEYLLFTKYKITFLITLLIIINALEILAVNASGYNGFGYLALLIIFCLALGIIVLIDLIVRLFYKLKYDQNFNFKSIYKENIIAKIIIIILIAAFFIIPEI